MPKADEHTDTRMANASQSGAFTADRDAGLNGLLMHPSVSVQLRGPWVARVAPRSRPSIEHPSTRRLPATNQTVISATVRGGAEGQGQPPDWPEGTRLIFRRDRPHPGAQLSFTDVDDHRFQCFITDQPDAEISALEATHRQHA